MIELIKEFLSLFKSTKSNTLNPININITIGNNNEDSSSKTTEKDKEK